MFIDVYSRQTWIMFYIFQQRLLIASCTFIKIGELSHDWYIYTIFTNQNFFYNREKGLQSWFFLNWTSYTTMLQVVGTQ